jgi:hypothetical protein
VGDIAASFSSPAVIVEPKGAVVSGQPPHCPPFRTFPQPFKKNREDISDISISIGTNFMVSFINDASDVRDYATQIPKIPDLQLIVLSNIVARALLPMTKK